MTRWTTIICVSVALTACAKSDDGPEAPVETGPIKIERVDPVEGLVIQEVDLDADGTPEIWTYYRELDGAARLQVRKKYDLNHDGRVDVVSHFDDRGALTLEEMDGDFDGLVDITDHYKDGARVLSEVDTNFDGRPDVFHYFTLGQDNKPRIDRKERDTDGDGKIDVWERYDSDGNVVRTGKDTDGDGKMDVRDE